MVELNHQQGRENFYYQKNGNQVTISNMGKVTAENGGTIFIACYDYDALKAIRMIEPNPNTKEFDVSNVTIDLPEGVKRLGVKLFAWDSTKTMIPLCKAKRYISPSTFIYWMNCVPTTKN